MLEKVKGQDEGVYYLRRVVDGQLKLPLLLVGEPGVGRFLSVQEAAKEIFDDPSQSKQIDLGIHPDFCVVRSGGSDIKADAIRDLIHEVNFQPSRAPLKILVVDGVDRMSDAASNALLKTLEESPPRVRFFLLAEDADQVIPTILSRCVLVRYRKLPEDLVLSMMPDGKDALVYSRIADGSIGRAILYSGTGRLTLRDAMFSLFRLATSKDLPGMFAVIDSLGNDIELGIRFFEQIFRDLLMVPRAACLYNPDLQTELSKLKPMFKTSQLTALRVELQGLQVSLRRNVNVAFHFKTALASVFA